MHPELVIHIGLNKCGSTTLQRTIFPLHPGFIGSAPGFGYDDNLAKRFQQFSPVAGRQHGNLQQARRWAQRLLERHDEDDDAPGTYVMSNEMLSQSNRLHPRPIVPFLKRFHDEVWAPRPLKVLVIVRSQAARLASSYAQTAPGRLGVRQADFEKFVRAALERKAALFDYSKWVAELSEAVGSSNVLCLPIEESTDASFWRALASFTDLPDTSATELMNRAAHGRKNTRRHDGHKAAWRLDAFDPSQAAKSFSGKVLNLLWPSTVAPRARSLSHRASTRVGRRVLRSRWVARRDREREERVVLTDEAREAVQAVCSPFNRRLEEQLGRDLSGLGY